MNSMDRLVLIDTETFGLNPKSDFIIELGFMIVDMDFNIIDDFQCSIWDSPSYDGRFSSLGYMAAQGDKPATLVLEMHNKSGLWSDVQIHGFTVEQAITRATDWLSKHKVGKEDPMVGSSVQFDREMLREQMLPIFDIFSYRNIDTSSIKELCRRFNPGVYAHLDNITQPKKLHRVVPDLQDTLGELEFYRNEFLLWS